MRIYGVCWDGDDRMWEACYFSTLEAAYHCAFDERIEDNEDEDLDEDEKYYVPTLDEVRAELWRGTCTLEYDGCYIGVFTVENSQAN